MASSTRAVGLFGRFYVCGDYRESIKMGKLLILTPKRNCVENRVFWTRYGIALYNHSLMNLMYVPEQQRLGLL